MKIDLELAGQIEEAVSSFDSEISLYKKYSGRGMFGRTCFGVYTSSRTAAEVLMGFMVTLLQHSQPTLVSFVEELSVESIATDSLGHQTLIYWPNVQWHDDKEESSKNNQ